MSFVAHASSIFSPCFVSCCDRASHWRDVLVGHSGGRGGSCPDWFTGALSSTVKRRSKGLRYHQHGAPIMTIISFSFYVIFPQILWSFLYSSFSLLLYFCCYFWLSFHFLCFCTFSRGLLHSRIQYNPIFNFFFRSLTRYFFTHLL